MPSKKKTVADEESSTTKKGITKTNTTRTQKITSKAKAANKRTAPVAKKSTTKKVSVKEDTSIKKSSTAKTAKTTKTKASTTKKKVSTKKEVKVKEQKTTTKRPRTKKMASNDKITSKTSLVEDFLTTEYYDLPFTYNKTVVKILAQTPEVLFVYWDISDDDRKKYIETYGENFFSETKPVLIITNKTMNYTFEVDINDFANSWYLHINDAKCEYSVELGRRPISHNVELPNNYLYVTSSNGIEAPNDHILFEKAQNMVYFRNVKTNVISSKSITSLSLLKNMGKIYNIYDFYKKIYKEEDFKDASRFMGNSSSIFK